ncbi:hypothetical protein BO78DRAFT_77588 [Aspergillus sclerotiicarbonarius CBS 121057]|uniref:Uncharacterized protein n=1 Tax=Aspergillus sclerotiicarbonarius (strain CBS 121057 / IBT 28362) TaxID=1448318 RepID=A0A319FJW5_ASPSB|nr:hypothetical protein BO78DRAFT_77588 [Aspergillus sclerotiicarbonarius CBS 121057]
MLCVASLRLLLHRQHAYALSLVALLHCALSLINFKTTPGTVVVVHPSPILIFASIHARLISFLPHQYFISTEDARR